MTYLLLPNPHSTHGYLFELFDANGYIYEINNVDHKIQNRTIQLSNKQKSVWMEVLSKICLKTNSGNVSMDSFKIENIAEKANCSKEVTSQIKKIKEFMDNSENINNRYRSFFRKSYTPCDDTVCKDMFGNILSDAYPRNMHYVNNNNDESYSDFEFNNNEEEIINWINNIIKKNKSIIFQGKLRSGKSYILNAIYKIACRNFISDYNVFFIDLEALINRAGILDTDLTETASTLEYSTDKANPVNFFDISKLENGKKIILFLDNYDSLFHNRNNNIHIKRILEELSFLDKNNDAIVIITTSNSSSLTTKERNILEDPRLYKIGDIKIDIPDEISFPPEIKSYLKKPYIYNLFEGKKLSEYIVGEKLSEYQLFNYFHIEFYNEYCLKANQDLITQYIYATFTFLPMIGYQMALSDKMEMSKNDVISLLENIFNSKTLGNYYNEILFNSSSSLFDIDQTDSMLNEQRIAFIPGFRYNEPLQRYYSMLLLATDYISFSSNGISFNSIEIRNYFACFKCIEFLKSLRITETYLEFYEIPDFIFETKDFRTMFLSGIKSYIGNAPYEDIFPDCHQLSPSYNVMEIQKQLNKEIYIASTIHKFHSQLKITEINNIHKKYAPFIESLLHYKDFFMLNQSLISGTQSNALLEILSDEIEYYTRIKRYDKCFELYIFASDCCFSVANKYYINEINYMKALALLSNAEDIYTGNHNFFYSSQLFNDAISLLKEVSPCNSDARTILDNIYCFEGTEINSKYKWIYDSKLIRDNNHGTSNSLLLTQNVDFK